MGVNNCYGAVLSVCPCVGVVLQSPQHERLVADILARMPQGCYEDATRKTASVEFKLKRYDDDDDDDDYDFIVILNACGCW